MGSGVEAATGDVGTVASAEDPQRIDRSGERVLAVDDETLLQFAGEGRESPAFEWIVRHCDDLSMLDGSSLGFQERDENRVSEPRDLVEQIGELTGSLVEPLLASPCCPFGLGEVGVAIERIS